MGGAMSRNLVKAGHDVYVYDINPQAVQERVADGAKATTSPAQAARDAEFVITVLQVGPIVEAVVFGDNGIAESISKEALYIDISTIAPEETQRIGKRLAQQGVHMIDAPAGRTSAHAAAGTSTFMVGGEDTDIARAMPLLEVLGESITNCGPLGSGAMVKLVNNYISAVINLATAEGLALAEAAGISHDIVADVISQTPAGQGHIRTTWPGKALKDDPTPAFMLDLAYKDMGLALDTAARLNVPLVTGSAARQIYAMARAQGRRRDDWTTGIFRTIRRLAGLT